MTESERNENKREWARGKDVRIGQREEKKHVCIQNKPRQWKEKEQRNERMNKQ